MPAKQILYHCRERGDKIAVAESCTGGLLSGALTEVAGSSDVFDRGYVTYSNAAKEDMLGVRAATLENHGAVSEEVAREMAEGALARSAASLAVAVTGVAGPGSSDAKPEGRVCFALATTLGTEAETIDFGALGRANVRAATVAHALDMLHRTVSG